MKNMSEELQAKTVKELREVCKSLDLPVYGTKAEIIERIEGHSGEATPRTSHPEAPEYEYVVTRAFKYNEREYVVGDGWEPQGGVWDAQLIAQEKYIKPIIDHEYIRDQKVKQATARHNRQNAEVTNGN